MLRTRQSPVPALAEIEEEGFVRYKALPQTSSWVSCDSNPFICSPSVPVRRLPNMLIHLHMPTYATVLKFHQQKNAGLFQITSNTKSCLQQNTDTNKRTAAPDHHASVKNPTLVKAHRGHVCTCEAKSLCRGLSAGSSCFPASPGLPVRIRGKAALPPLNVSWCLPGCLFGEEIKGEPLPLALFNRERGAEGRREQKRGESFNEDRLNEYIQADR